MADGNVRRDNIKSKEKFDVENSTEVVDSTDLLYLAVQLNELESAYKITVIDALNRIGTYFRNDGSVSADVNLNEVDTKEGKRKCPLEI